MQINDFSRDMFKKTRKTNDDFNTDMTKHPSQKIENSEFCIGEEAWRPESVSDEVSGFRVLIYAMFVNWLVPFTGSRRINQQVMVDAEAAHGNVILQIDHTYCLRWCGGSLTTRLHTFTLATQI